MSQPKGAFSRIAVLVAILALGIALLPSGARAQALSDVFSVNHFDVTVGDGTVRTINPTTTSAGILCEMVYVFDAHEELEECCGCPVTNDGLRVISTVNDLTKNPLGGPNPTTGVIRIVSAVPNGTPTSQYGMCNPAVNVIPTETLRSFSTHTYNGGFPRITETEFLDSPLTTAELGTLTSVCAFIHVNGTGRGICTCGTGDNSAPLPGSGGR